MEWDWRLRTGHHWPIVHPPGECVNVSGEPWWWCQLGINPDLSTRARWQSYQQRYLERMGGMDEGVRILHIHYLWYVNGSFTWRKILRHGTFPLYFASERKVLRIFIALKNPSPWPGLNPRPLGPVTSTLTTTPPRRLWVGSYAVWTCRQIPAFRKNILLPSSGMKWKLNIYSPEDWCNMFLRTAGIFTYVATNYW
jgi:hypothetical protein